MMINEFVSSLRNLINELPVPEDVAYQHHALLDALVNVTGDSYPKIIELLQNKTADNDLRGFICWAFGELHDKSVIGVLQNLLNEDNRPLWPDVLLTLSKIGNEQSVESVIRLLSDEDQEIREAVVYCLGWIGNYSTLHHLIKIVRDQNESIEIRASALEAFANIGDNQVVPIISEMLSDASPKIRYWAVYALGHLADEEILPDLERLAIEDQSLIQEYQTTVASEAQQAIVAIKTK